MGGFEERIEGLWHYGTSYGSVEFNVVSVVASVLQILSTAIVLGHYHSVVGIEYLWWPVFECARLLVLTLARVDVLLKDASELARQRHENPNTYAMSVHSWNQTRRVVMLCNLVGVGSIVIAAPIYLVLLPSGHSQLRTVTLVMFVTFIAIRMALTYPMFFALWKGQPFSEYDTNGPYEPIGDLIRRQSESSVEESLEEREREREREQLSTGREPRGRTDMSRSHGLMPEHVLQYYDERQMQLALEASRRESDRNLRRSQDLEYVRAEEEQRRLEEQKIQEQIQKQSKDERKDERKDNDNEEEDDSGMDTEEEINAAIAVSLCESKADELQRLSAEPSQSTNTVSVRIRLPNGTRSCRRFVKSASIADIKVWVNHELAENDSKQLIGQFRLLTPIPRTVYDNDCATMTELGFWRPNATRELLSPMLYVEEIA